MNKKIGTIAFETLVVGIAVFGLVGTPTTSNAAVKANKVSQVKNTNTAKGKAGVSTTSEDVDAVNAALADFSDSVDSLLATIADLNSSADSTNSDVTLSDEAANS